MNNTPVKTRAGFFDWTFRALIAVIVWIAVRVNDKVDSILLQVTAQQEQVRTLKEDNERFKNKLYVFNNIVPFGKKEEEITFKNVVNKEP